MLDKIKMVEVYHIPQVCSECGGVMVFKGVGEYQCEDCKRVDYDDYGKVRRFIELHPGANAAQIEHEVGVSQKTIRKLLKEGRIEIAENSAAFLRCEICGKQIRSGELCPECEVTVHRNMEAEQRKLRQHNSKGVGMGQRNEDGQRRFRRDS